MDAAKLSPEDSQVLIGMLRTRLMEVPEGRLKGNGAVHRVSKQQAASTKPLKSIWCRFLIG